MLFTPGYIMRIYWRICAKIAGIKKYIGVFIMIVKLKEKEGEKL